MKYFFLLKIEIRDGEKKVPENSWFEGRNHSHWSVEGLIREKLGTCWTFWWYVFDENFQILLFYFLVMVVGTSACLVVAEEKEVEWREWGGNVYFVFGGSTRVGKMGER